jgi:hypothetical protein
MPVTFSNPVILSSTWTVFKSSAITGKSLLVQYQDDGSIYTIFAIDLSIAYTCIIWKGTVPDGVINSGYSQAQNDTDKADFENNYKAQANKTLTPKSQVNLGYTTSVGSALTAIRATAYVQQTTNAQRSLVSSSASDTAAGAGAQSIKITYYDQTLAGPFTETVSLNGITAVNTVGTNICFIEKMECTSVGNQLSNVGTITLTISTGGAGGTIGTIAAGDGITNWCHHYVATGKTMNLVSVIGTIQGQNSGAMEVHRTVPTDTTKTELTIAPKYRITTNSSGTLSFNSPIMVAGPALVLVYGRSDASTGNLNWSVGMGYYEA